MSAIKGRTPQTIVAGDTIALESNRAKFRPPDPLTLHLTLEQLYPLHKQLYQLEQNETV